jgi:hypothetical protein
MWECRTPTWISLLIVFYVFAILRALLDVEGLSNLRPTYNSTCVLKLIECGAAQKMGGGG